MKSELKSENVKPITSPTYPQSLDDFFSRKHPQLILLQVSDFALSAEAKQLNKYMNVVQLQLPDSLPGHGPDREPADSASVEQNSFEEDPVSRCTFCTFFLNILCNHLTVCRLLHHATVRRWTFR